MIYKGLRILSHPSKPLLWWYKQRDVIDFDPPYQRKGRLWSRSDKAYLIDSIINGFDIPKLYMADFQMGGMALNRSGKEYAIIDGKQRFEAVFDFFDHALTLNADFVWRRDPSLKLGGLSLRDLRNSYPDIADAFETETFDVMSVVTDDSEDINELFVRLNRSKPLSGAEIRNAMIGAVPDMIRNVAKHELFTDYIRFSTKRAGDFNAAAKIVLFEYRGSPASTKKSDLDAFAQLRRVEAEKLDLAGNHCLTHLDSMTQVFLPRDILLASAGVFPVYYWFVRVAHPSLYSYIREFLVQFEGERAEARARAARDENLSDERDYVYSRYDTFNRSTDDRRSHLGRLGILATLFGDWLRGRHLTNPVPDLSRRVRELRSTVQHEIDEGDSE
ncbi:MAG: DUF262 domain-containing protein [Alphaproteobacteria bacterium]|nr:MAG: DUF262 domain-containing protein [Alphaproteobacteria bacterium]